MPTAIFSTFQIVILCSYSYGEWSANDLSIVLTVLVNYETPAHTRYQEQQASLWRSEQFICRSEYICSWILLMAMVIGQPLILVPHGASNYLQ